MSFILILLLEGSLLHRSPIAVHRPVVLILLALLVLGLVPYQGAARPAHREPDLASPFGLNTHLGTRYPAPGFLNRPATSVDQLGVAWAREDFPWPRIEPRPNAWDWRVLDEMVAAHEERGVAILGRLGYSVGWATADSNDPYSDQSFSFPDLGAWRRYIRTTAQHYRGRVRYWEVWNEPDNGVFWQGTPDPQAFARLLRAAYEEIKAVDPENMVLIGGVSPWDSQYLRGIALAGAWDAFDILAIHPYIDPLSPEAGRIGASGVAAARALLNRYGHKPIWVTEIGWESGISERNSLGSVDERTQANYLVRAYLTLLAEPGVEKVFWYTLHDDTDSPFGLVRFGKGYTDYSSRKPAFDAYATMTRELSGARFERILDLSTDRRVVETWEGSIGWVPAADNGTLTTTTDRRHSGRRAARIDYLFPTDGNDYVAFRPVQPLELGHPSSVGIWVFGNTSGHLVQIQLEDESGEVLQYPLGIVEGAEWIYMQTPVTGTPSAGNRLGGGDNNGRLDGMVSVRALVVDDLPNAARVKGTMYVDDLTVIGGNEVYGFRWTTASETIDVIYAPIAGYVHIPTTSARAMIVDYDGKRTQVVAKNGEITVAAYSRPRYIHHNAP